MCVLFPLIYQVLRGIIGEYYRTYEKKGWRVKELREEGGGREEGIRREVE